MILYFSATGNSKYVAARLAVAAFRSSLSSRICKNGSAENSAEPSCLFLCVFVDLRKHVVHAGGVAGIGVHRVEQRASVVI